MVEVAIADPLKDHVVLGFVYLFVSEQSAEGRYLLKQDANEPRVEYNFSLTSTSDSGSNDYFEAYKFGCDDPNANIHQCPDDEVMNPEDTWFKSKTYQRHFAENWQVYRC